MLVVRREQRRSDVWPQEPASARDIARMNVLTRRRAAGKALAAGAYTLTPSWKAGKTTHTSRQQITLGSGPPGAAGRFDLYVLDEDFSPRTSPPHHRVISGQGDASKLVRPAQRTSGTQPTTSPRYPTPSQIPRSSSADSKIQQRATPLSRGCLARTPVAGWRSRSREGSRPGPLQEATAFRVGFDANPPPVFPTPETRAPSMR